MAIWATYILSLFSFDFIFSSEPNIHLLARLEFITSTLWCILCGIILSAKILYCIPLVTTKIVYINATAKWWGWLPKHTPCDFMLIGKLLNKFNCYLIHCIYIQFSDNYLVAWQQPEILPTIARDIPVLVALLHCVVQCKWKREGHKLQSKTKWVIDKNRLSAAAAAFAWKSDDGILYMQCLNYFQWPSLACLTENFWSHLVYMCCHMNCHINCYSIGCHNLLFYFK